MSAKVLQLPVLLAFAAGCAAPQWTTHNDPAGFSMEVPSGWRVTRDAASGRAEVNGPQERLVIWPLFTRARLDARAAGPLLSRAGSLVAPGATWGPPRAAGTQALRTEGRAGDRAAVASLVLIPSAKGTACYLYAAAAPEASYRQSAGTFARILASFHITGAPVAQSGTPEVAYVSWCDPREKAFQVEAPRGWKIDGGLFRFASVDTRVAWSAESPDGIRVTAGDQELPTFTEPTQVLAFSGFREGSWYSPGYGMRMLVRRYMPGVHFAREYVVSRAARGCTELHVTSQRDRADAVAAINKISSQLAPGFVASSLAAGEVAFTCSQQGRPMAGYYFAGTRHTAVASMPGGLWNAEYLYGFLAPIEKQQLAQSVLEHALRTFEINPQWAAMQQNITANTSRIVARTNTEISNIISDSYARRQETMDELSRRRSNATLGVLDVVDPATGETTKVESGSNYYWVDQRGTIVGTDTDTRPNLDFRGMVQLP
jgi:hypothetical protein